VSDPWKPFRDGFKVGVWNPFLIGAGITAVLFAIALWK
jgi:hypothetical protein